MVLPTRPAIPPTLSTCADPALGLILHRMLASVEVVPERLVARRAPRRAELEGGERRHPAHEGFPRDPPADRDRGEVRPLVPRREARRSVPPQTDGREVAVRHVIAHAPEERDQLA